MPIDPVTAQAIIDEVNALVDGAGAGFVKIRVRGGRAVRIYPSPSKPLPVAGELPEILVCPKDGATLKKQQDGPERRWWCYRCRYAWRAEQLLRLLRNAPNGSARTATAA